MADTEPGIAGTMPAIGSRAGSFELTEPAGSWGEQARFRARGAAGSEHDGAAALVVAVSTAGADPAQIDAAVARLNAIVALRHEGLLPVIEAGAWEGGLYLAHHLPDAETLGDRLARAGSYAPADAADVIDRLAAALDAAAAAGVPHGDVRLANVWLRSDGGPALGGFAIAPAGSRSAAADAAGLAAVLASLLSGREVAVAVDGDAAMAPAWDPPFGVPEVVRAAVQRGIGPDPAARYPSAGSLAAAFRESIAAAAAIQVAGAWEAIERRDYGMAQILCEAAYKLRPDDLGIEALAQHIRANGLGAPSSLAAFELGGLPPAPAPSADRSPVAGLAESAEPTSGSGSLAEVGTLPPELAQLFALPPSTKASGANAWVTLATGMVILVALALLAALVALSYR